MKTMYFDLDGVMCDYESLRDIRHYRAKDFFLDLEPIPGAIEAFHILNERYNTYFLSTAPWSAPLSWTDKRLWVEKHLGGAAHKKLILTHNKGLLKGDYLIDDRIANGVADFEGIHIHFGSDDFPDWNSVLDYFDDHEAQDELAASMSLQD